jgi:hypothetical protein
MLLKGDYLHFKFRDTLQSLVDLFILIGYILLEVFDIFSG